jgi:nicotinamidase-related amidase
MIAQSSTDTLVVTGFETDVCVLATVLSAVDMGRRVVLIQDRFASSNDEGANATMEKVFPRFDQQVEIVDSEELFRSWRK